MLSMSSKPILHIWCNHGTLFICEHIGFFKVWTTLRTSKNFFHYNIRFLSVWLQHKSFIYPCIQQLCLVCIRSESDSLSSPSLSESWLSVSENESTNLQFLHFSSWNSLLKIFIMSAIRKNINFTLNQYLIIPLLYRFKTRRLRHHALLVTPNVILDEPCELTLRFHLRVLLTWGRSVALWSVSLGVFVILKYKDTIPVKLSLDTTRWFYMRVLPVA